MKKFGLLVVLLAILGCRVTNVPLWKVPSPQPADALAVREVREVAYFSAAKADPFRHTLDLYVPRDKKDFPVVVLVHGGAWLMGDNRCCGLYSSVGEFLASRGIGAVLPNYRLSPGVKHPEHIKDVARAFAWTKKNIAKYGGDPDRLFLVGHSAGGHLVALLATQEKYLRAEGCTTADIRGVVGVSGVYHIPPGDMKGILWGSGPDAMHFRAMFPIRGNDTDRPTPRPPMERGDGLTLAINVFGPSFGNDPEVRAEASPLKHVRPGLPPFLLLYAEHELPALSAMAEDFRTALAAQKCDAKALCMTARNHNTILFRAVTVDDAVARNIVEFVGVPGK